MIISKNDIKSVLIQLQNLEVTDGMGIFEEFRKKIKNIFNVNYVLVTNNGTSGLYLAYKAIGLKENDEVITGTYTYHSTNSTLLNFTKNIIFCDYGNDITISLDEIKKNISDKTKLLVIPHTWGLSTNMREIIKLKEKYKNLFIIEDCSQAHFAKYDNKYLGTFGDIGVFSMQGGKLITSGEGGFVITDKIDLYEKMLVNTDSGRTLDNLLCKDSEFRKYIETGLGLMKFRANPIGIAFANSQLDTIFDKIIIRKYIATLIKLELENIKFLDFPNISNLDSSFYALVAIYRKEKNNNISISEFLKKLRTNNMFEVYNPKNNKPSHLLPLFEKISGIEKLKNSEFIYNNLLYFKITDDLNKKDEIINYLKKLKLICQK